MYIMYLDKIFGVDPPQKLTVNIFNVTLPKHTSNYYPDPPRRPENINLTLPFEAPAHPPSINVRSLSDQVCVTFNH